MSILAKGNQYKFFFCSLCLPLRAVRKNQIENFNLRGVPTKSTKMNNLGHIVVEEVALEGDYGEIIVMHKYSTSNSG